MKIDFEDISYLMMGNARQIHSYKLLTDNLILENLIEFDPILVGTIPLAIDIDSSDLDIICCYSDVTRFLKTVIYCFDSYEAFQVQNKSDRTVVTFSIDGVQIELFGQAVPTKEQHGYRHMLIEYRLLQLHGDDFRRKVIALKIAGVKTELAFCMLLGVPGDPYEGLLSYNFEN
jgi:hypothetical protein